MEIFRYLRSALGEGADGPADSELLSRFVASRDESAFELLVWRHAGMVLRSAMSVLKDHHHAEDVCQATFLALSKNAKIISEKQALAAWLQTVSYRMALRMNKKNKKTISLVNDQIANRETVRNAELYEEVNRLPEIYRAPLLLCFWEGLSQEDAGKRLGWPTGTVAGRIARAKETLKDRLSKKTALLSLAGLTALLNTQTAPALSPTFVSKIVTSAFAFSSQLSAKPFQLLHHSSQLSAKPFQLLHHSSQLSEITVSGLSPTVVELAQGALQTMTLSKLKLFAGIALLAGTLSIGTIWVNGQTGLPGGGPGGGLGGPPGGPPVQSEARGGGPPQPQQPLTTKEDQKPSTKFPNCTYEQREKSFADLKNILLGFHNYESTFQYFPHDIYSNDAKPLLSWRVAILSYIGKDDLYKKFKLDEAWDSPHNFKLLSEMPSLYSANPKDLKLMTTYYKCFSGSNTIMINPEIAVKLNGAVPGGGPGGAGLAIGGPSGFGGEGGVGPGGGGPAIGGGGFGGPGMGLAKMSAEEKLNRLKVRIGSIKDGTSNTIAVVEAGDAVPWTKPIDIPYDAQEKFKLAEGPYANLMNTAFCDGSVSSLKRDLPEAKYKALISKDGGELFDNVDIFARLYATKEEKKAAVQKILDVNKKNIAELKELLTEYEKFVIANAEKESYGIDKLEYSQKFIEGISIELKIKLNEYMGLIPPRSPKLPAKTKP